MTKIVKIYLAAGWFNDRQMGEIQMLEKLLSLLPTIDMYSPRLQNNCPPDASEDIKKNIFIENVSKIKESDLVIVNTRDKDLGTIFEAGCAFMTGRPIIYFCYGLKGNFNLMLAKSGIAVATDYVDLKEHIDKFIIDPTYKSEYIGRIE